jgi:biotin carboxyl carrier protein
MLRKLASWAIALLILAGAIGWGGYVVWKSRQVTKADSDEKPAPAAMAGAVQSIRLTEQARNNLGLTSKPLQPTTYWRKIEIPGVLADRPGVSDRGVVSPVTGVVTNVHAHPGDLVEPNSPLFSIRLVSESLHASQLELFKATREIEIAEEQRKRLSGVAQSGAVAQSRVVDIENQIRRLEVTVQAYRQDLQARGLSADRITAAARGEFVTEITVHAPGEQALENSGVALVSAVNDETRAVPFRFEMQVLRIELGQQVEAGQLLCTLADHRALLIEGHAFKDDMPLIQEAARQGWEIEVEFDQPADDAWPPLAQKFSIQHVANTIDEESRTFAFFLPLENQWQTYTRDGQTRLLWRFRPGDRVRLHVAVEKMDDVFVVPREAVVREGPDAYLFRHNGELFDRKPVYVLYEDRQHMVLANDGSVKRGFFVAQNAAASLNRVLKAQAASGLPADVHVHADGTVHAAH